MNILSNKTYKEYSYISRYTPFPYYYNNNRKNYECALTAYVDDSTIYTLYTVVNGDTLDSIALRFYNNPTLFWVICSFNRILDPFKDLEVGTTIKVPKLSNINYDFVGRE